MDASRDNVEAALTNNRQLSLTTLKKAVPLSAMLVLAYEAIGIVYGDIGTSPLYVYATAFGNGVSDVQDVVGSLSLIIWTLTLSPVVKYCWVVLWCDDNGEGGTFAAYGLLARNLGIIRDRAGHVPYEQSVSQFTTEPSSPKHGLADSIKSVLQGSRRLQMLLLFTVLMATCLIIGDGVLTPAQSVLSAVGGINNNAFLSQNVVVGVSIAFLALLFLVQRFGTSRIGVTFAPVVIVWLLVIAVVGVWNLARYDAWFVLKAFSPHYGIAFLVRNGTDGWISLGGLFLCITGTEAMYADLGHFSARSVSLSFTFFVYPCLLLAYIGQAAFLSVPDNMALVGATFYKSIPQHPALYWPIFVVATAAAAVASQSMISATFSIVNQSMALGCFPRVKVVHTSTTVKGQIYIPEINYLLMALTLLVTGVMGQNGTTTIGNAYGIAVSGVMLITTFLITLVLIAVKKKSVFMWLPFLLFFTAFETVYLSSNLYKVPQGGWVPLAFAGVFMTVMSVWFYGSSQELEHEKAHKLSLDWVSSTMSGGTVSRVPGLGVFYSDLTAGVPNIFAHFLASVPAVHEVVVFLAVRHIEVPHVALEERYVVKRVGPLGVRMFTCVLRYGYNDVTSAQSKALSDELVAALTRFVRTEDPSTWSTALPQGTESGDDNNVSRAVKEEEVERLVAAKSVGVVHIVGRRFIRARDGNTFRKLVLDYAYFFLKANTRDACSNLGIPRDSTLEVGSIINV